MKLSTGKNIAISHSLSSIYKNFDLICCIRYLFKQGLYASGYTGAYFDLSVNMEGKYKLRIIVTDLSLYFESNAN